MHELLQRFTEVLSHPMALFGLLGQLLFFSRFLVQWIVSERKRRSTIPIVFWYLSIGGSLMLLTYAIWRGDPIITLGQLTGVVIYVRNLILLKRSAPPRKTEPWPQTPHPGS